jgi:Vitamin B6 photo-protection and homoeostasis
VYDSIQGFCSYLRNIVCTAALFEVMGVGDTNSTAWNATIVWAIRDGTGLLGGLWYTYCISPYLDAYVKEFRLFADIINDLGFTLDMLLPLCITHETTTTNDSSDESTTTATTTKTKTMLFWYISSLSVLCKMMCGISAGATKSSITCHFAIRGNMADLNAKESTQETIVTLLGMMGGIYVAKLFQTMEQTHINNDDTTTTTTANSRLLTWIFFSILTLIHLYANYCGVSLLKLRTINTSRIHSGCFQFDSHLVPQIRQYISQQQLSSTTVVTNTNQQVDEQYQQIRTIISLCIVTPEDVQEIMYLSIWQWFGFIPKSHIYCKIPQSKLQPYFHHSLLGQMLLLVQQQQQQSSLPSQTEQEQKYTTINETVLSSVRYNVTVIHHGTDNRKPTRVAITLCTGATAMDELRAYTHAKIVLVLLSLNKKSVSTTDPQSSESVGEILFESYSIVQLLFQTQQGQPLKQDDNSDGKDHNSLPLFVSELQNKGWEITRFYFNFPSQRCELVRQSPNNLDDEEEKMQETDSPLTKKKDN